MKFEDIAHLCMYIHNAVVYTGFRGWGGSREQRGGVFFDIGESKNLAFFQTRKFSKNVKKSMEKTIGFGKFLRKFAIF